MRYKPRKIKIVMETRGFFSPISLRNEKYVGMRFWLMIRENRNSTEHFCAHTAFLKFWTSRYVIVVTWYYYSSFPNSSI